MKKFGGYLLILIMLLGIVSGTILASEQTAVQSETTATISNTSNTNAASVTGDIEQSTTLGHHGPGPDIHIGLDGGPETAILLLTTLFILVLFLQPQILGQGALCHRPTIQTPKWVTPLVNRTRQHQFKKPPGY